MIRIKKPSAPIVRDRAGSNKLFLKTQSDKSLYDASSAAYDNGTINFNFDNKLYGHSKIKRVLIKCHFGKCAFCESNVSSISSGDVEHFRPKAGFKQNENSDNLVKPGYYWLAYDWNNLLFSCEICNRRRKLNLFPLRNPEKRALNHNQDIGNEKPFFVNPCYDNPDHFIGFREEVAYGKDKNNRGKKTINALGLNRKGDGYSDLIEIRKDLYERTRAVYKISKLTAPIPGFVEQHEIDEAQVLMNSFRSNMVQFSSMIKNNFP